MINELIFLIQILTISGFIAWILNKKNTLFLYAIFSSILILLNILVNQEVNLFGLTACTIEPYAVGLFWISSIIYMIEKEEGAKKLITCSFITNAFSLIMFMTVFFYTPNAGSDWTEIYDKLLSKYILSIIISTFTFILSYYLERKTYNYLTKYISNKILTQTLSVSFGQLADTILFGFLYFNKPTAVIFEIVFFSYIIKFICIIIYMISFSSLKKYINKGYSGLYK